MAVIETWLKQDLKKPVQVKELGGHLFSADNMANQIGVEVFSDGTPVSLVDGATAYVIRDDGYTVAVTGTVSGNRASVVLPESCYAVVGPISIVIKNGRTTIGACRGYVYRSTTDSIVDPGHVIPSLDELLAQISAMQTATAQAQTATRDANAAAAAANSAASSANTAAENANEKAELADTKAALANTAAGSANSAASLANTKAGLADTAASNANTKADLADNKATIANNAASNADAKATLANTAAANADEKATLADDAASNANAKAELANSKAELANTAAQTANAAAVKIDNMTVASSGLPTGSAPTVAISEVSGHKHIAFGIPKGDKGKDFHISFTFASIAEMNAYSGEIELYDYAMIDTGSVEDADTGKLFCYESDSIWHYIGDLSGAQGIKGETGTGIDHVALNADYTLTVYFDDGTSYTTGSIRGATGITPNFTVGTVSTLNPDQQATATITGTPERPVLNLGIPKGETGSVESVYSTSVPISESDSRSVKQVLDLKLESVPVMSGATTQDDGASGLVPAPLAGASTKYLRNDGTWSVPPDTHVPVDSALDNASQNPVQNSVIANALETLSNNISNYWKTVYPVGSIYMSAASTSPETLFGGTWEQLKDRFLLGVGDTYDTADTTGGAASQSYTPDGTVGNHTLTTAEIPSHNHTFTGSAVNTGNQSQDHTHTGTSGDISKGHTHTGTSGNPDANHTHTGPSHTHSGPSHTHTGPSHTHSLHALNTSSTSGAHMVNATVLWGNSTQYPSGSVATPIVAGGTGNTGSGGTGATGSAGTGATGTVSAWHKHTTTTGTQSQGHTHTTTTGGVSKDHTHSVTAAGSIGNTGGGGGHNHGFTGTTATISTMPPYLTVYMWKRTA